MADLIGLGDSWSSFCDATWARETQTATYDGHEPLECAPFVLMLDVPAQTVDQALTLMAGIDYWWNLRWFAINLFDLLSADVRARIIKGICASSPAIACKTYMQSPHLTAEEREWLWTAFADSMPTMREKLSPPDALVAPTEMRR